MNSTAKKTFLLFCRPCIGVLKQMRDIQGIDELFDFWRGNRNAFTRYIDRKFWIWDD